MIRKILLLSLILIIYACQEDDNEDYNPEASLTNVSLEIDGDFLTSFSEYLPSGRINNLEKTYLGIKVYRISNNTNLFYANGVFSELEDLNIQLNSSESYAFEVGAIRTGTSNGLCIENNAIEAFRGSNHEITNSFSFDELEYFKPNETSNTSLFIDLDSSTCNTQFTPEIDFFYANIDDYQIESDSSITINLARVSYGLGFKVTGLDSGQVVLNVSNNLATNYDLTLNSIDTTMHTIRVFDGNYDANEITDQFEEDLLVEANWILRDNEGNILENQLIGTNTITVKRNVLRMFNFSFDLDASTSSGNRLGLEFEDEMTPEEYTITFN